MLAKRLMEKSLHDSTDPHIALLEWRNTPTEGIGSSPAQRLLGRRVKTLLPMLSRKLEPRIVGNTREKLLQRKEKETFYYNKNARRTDMKSLKRGDTVRIRPFRNHSNGWTKATVEGQVDIRSYQVRTEDGRSYRRNRVDLKPTNELCFEKDDTLARQYDMSADEVQVAPSSSQQRESSYVKVNSSSSSNVNLDTLPVSQPAQLDVQKTNPITPAKMTTRGRSVLPARFKDFKM